LPDVGEGMYEKVKGIAVTCIDVYVF